ncbi:MAG TPA: glycosyltransferase family 4 protein [Candidatus Angelobacter sp.]
MRILAFSSLFPNAAAPAHGIFVYRRSSSIADTPGTQVEAIAPVPFVPSWIKGARWSRFARVPKSETIGKVQVYHPRYPLLPRVSMVLHGLLMFLGARKTVRDLHHQQPFDCISASYVYPDGFAAVLLSKMLRVPVVVWALGTDINLFPSFRTIRPLIRWTLSHASGIIAVSSALKNRMIELGVPEEKIQFIGNGVDTELFHLRDRQESRRALGLPNDVRILVSVAALREAKGHQHVIAALAKIAPRYPGLRLYLVGEGDHRRQIERLVQKLALQDRVFLAGSRCSEEIPLWFNAADLSLLASSREGWPNVILESLACGTPVIGTPVGQIPEILAPGGLGLVAQPDPESLAAAIEEALGRSWDRAALMKFAHARPWKTVGLEARQYLARVVGEKADAHSSGRTD